MSIFCTFLNLSTGCPKNQSIFGVSQESIYLQGVPRITSTGCTKNQSIYRVSQEAMPTFKVIVTYHEISKMWSDKKLDTLNTDHFESEYSLWTLFCLIRSFPFFLVIPPDSDQF